MIISIIVWELQKMLFYWNQGVKNADTEQKLQGQRGKPQFILLMEIMENMWTQTAPKGWKPILSWSRPEEGGWQIGWVRGGQGRKERGSLGWHQLLADIRIPTTLTVTGLHVISEPSLFKSLEEEVHRETSVVDRRTLTFLRIPATMTGPHMTFVQMQD